MDKLLLELFLINLILVIFHTIFVAIGNIINIIGIIFSGLICGCILVMWKLEAM